MVLYESMMLLSKVHSVVQHKPHTLLTYELYYCRTMYNSKLTFLVIHLTRSFTHKKHGIDMQWAILSLFLVNFCNDKLKLLIINVTKATTYFVI